MENFFFCAVRSKQYRRKNLIRSQGYIFANFDFAKNKSGKDSSDSTKKTKRYVEKTNKLNNSPSKIKSKGVKLKTIKRKKIRVETLGDS